MKYFISICLSLICSTSFAQSETINQRYVDNQQEYFGGEIPVGPSSTVRLSIDEHLVKIFNLPFPNFDRVTRITRGELGAKCYKGGVPLEFVSIAMQVIEDRFTGHYSTLSYKIIGCTTADGSPGEKYEFYGSR